MKEKIIYVYIHIFVTDYTRTCAAEAITGWVVAIIAGADIGAICVVADLLTEMQSLSTLMHLCMLTQYRVTINCVFNVVFKIQLGLDYAGIILGKLRNPGIIGRLWGIIGCFCTKS